MPAVSVNLPLLTERTNGVRCSVGGYAVRDFLNLHVYFLILIYPTQVYYAARFPACRDKKGLTVAVIAGDSLAAPHCACVGGGGTVAINVSLYWFASSEMSR